MGLTFVHSTNALWRVTLKTLAFGFLSFAAIFCASAGYGLFKMLRQVFSGDVPLGIAEFTTHSGFTIVFFVFAGIAAFVTKKCL